MSLVEFDISMPVDGFITVPNINELEQTELVESQFATHLRFRVVK